MKSSSLIWLTAVSSQANHSECRDHNMLDDRKCSIALLLQLPDAALCLMRVCITRRYPAAFHHCGCSMFWQRWQGTATDKKNCCMDRAPGACLTVCLTTEPTCSTSCSHQSLLGPDVHNPQHTKTHSGTHVRPCIRSSMPATIPPEPPQVLPQACSPCTRAVTCCCCHRAPGSGGRPAPEGLPGRLAQPGTAPAAPHPGRAVPAGE